MLKRSFDLDTFGGKPGVIVEPYQEIPIGISDVITYHEKRYNIFNILRIIETNLKECKNNLEKEDYSEAYKKLTADEIKIYERINKRFQNFPNYDTLLSKLYNPDSVFTEDDLENLNNVKKETKSLDEIESTIYEYCNFKFDIINDSITTKLFNLINNPVQYQK